MYMSVTFCNLLRPIGQSRGFAFAQFVGIPDARRFLDRHYPSIELHGTYDPNNAAPAVPAKVRVAYSRDRDDRDRSGKSDDDWKCDVVSPGNPVSKMLLTWYSATYLISRLEIFAFDAMHLGQV